MTDLYLIGGKLFYLFVYFFAQHYLPCFPDHLPFQTLFGLCSCESSFICSTPVTSSDGKSGGKKSNTYCCKNALTLSVIHSKTVELAQFVSEGERRLTGENADFNIGQWECSTRPEKGLFNRHRAGKMCL